MARMVGGLAQMRKPNAGRCGRDGFFVPRRAGDAGRGFRPGTGQGLMQEPTDLHLLMDPAFTIPNAALLAPADYAQWVGARVRAEMIRRRLALGKTPYSMALPGLLTAQTIRNIESGTHSPRLDNLALISQRLDAPLESLVLASLG